MPYRLIFCLLPFFLFCCSQTSSSQSVQEEPKEPLKTGAEQPEKYLPELRRKRVALVVNQTSQVGDSIHLVDFLLKEKVDIIRIFAPEHGFRGQASAGEKIADGKDARTGLPIHSLYGKTKKPSADLLRDLDAVIFDIQDVGARFYTYISTLHYVMEACAENELPLWVFDRPNPNGHYVDGPVLEAAHRSFVGMHPIPVVHGLTIGELAQMINGEGWLPEGASCPLTVIPCQGYTHSTPYELPVRPSPNLPTARAIGLYPALCFFEGTVLSAGRGTPFPFEVIGHPELPQTRFTFTPQPNEGAKYPKHEGKRCYGFDLREQPFDTDSLQLGFLVEAYRAFPHPDKFFNAFFTKLAGTKSLQQQIEDGKSPAEIRQSWAPALAAYRQMRKQYLLYPE